MLPLHQTFPGVHTQLRREASPPQGEHSITAAIKSGFFFWDEKANNVSVLVLQQGGVLSLIDCTLIEEPDNNDEEGESSWIALEHAGSSHWLGGALEQWQG